MEQLMVIAKELSSGPITSGKVLVAFIVVMYIYLGRRMWVSLTRKKG